MKWKAITPCFTVNDTWDIHIEKKYDDNVLFVLVRFCNFGIVKERLFKTEEEANDYIKYLTDDNF